MCCLLKCPPLAKRQQLASPSADCDEGYEYARQYCCRVYELHVGFRWLGTHASYCYVVCTAWGCLHGGAPILCKHSRIRSAKHHAGHASAFAVTPAINRQHLTRKNRWGDAYIECSALRFLIDVAAAVSVGAVAHTSSNSTSLSLESESTRLLTSRLLACDRAADALWTLAT